jgi:Succinyl-CoA synthetase, alpha subunit
MIKRFSFFIGMFPHLCIYLLSLISVYKKMEDAMSKNKDADVLVNFASLRSAYDSTIETLGFPQIRSIAIIAEGIFFFLYTVELV